MLDGGLVLSILVPLALQHPVDSQLPVRQKRFVFVFVFLKIKLGDQHRVLGFLDIESEFVFLDEVLLFFLSQHDRGLLGRVRLELV